jgi:hypothetical protein
MAAAAVPDLLLPDHIQQRTSTTPKEPPPVLEMGELAVNLADEVLYVGKGGSNAPIRISPVSTDAGTYF